MFDVVKIIVLVAAILLVPVAWTWLAIYFGPDDMWDDDDDS